VVAGEQHHRPPLFPSEPPRRTAVSIATSSTRSKLEHFFSHRFSPNELTIARRYLCTPSPAITLRRTAQPRSPPVSTHSPSTTSCSSCHRRPHRSHLPHHCQPSMVRPIPPYHHPWIPLGPEFLPGTTFSGESLPAGRNQSAGPHRQRGGGELPCFTSGRKAEVGWAFFESAGLRHCRSSPNAQCLFLISIRIYSIQILV
jgi:hypothetical protein